MRAFLIIAVLIAASAVVWAAPAPLVIPPRAAVPYEAAKCASLVRVAGLIASARDRRMARGQVETLVRDAAETERGADALVFAVRQIYASGETKAEVEHDAASVCGLAQ